MIKKVTISDYHEIALLMMKVFKEAPWNESWSYERSYQRIEQLNDGKYTRCFVYLINDKIVGVLCGKLLTYVDTLDLMIEDFYIDNDYQRQGLGQKLMQQVIKELDEVDNFTLLTGRDYYSKDFYLKSGFMVNEDMVFMVKPLVLNNYEENGDILTLGD